MSQPRSAPLGLADVLWLAMQQLTADGQAVVSDLASRHGFSTDAVTHMLFAVLGGNGGMAQFSHGEFGGSGQWMRGGMLMIGDMFNGHLKGRVDSLCWDISNLLANQPGLLREGSFQSQSQGGGGHQHQGSGAPAGGSSLFVPDPEDNWWPPELGTPNATGAQNNARYAYFSGSRRLAVKTGADVWVYDTQDHQIGGFSQQQGVGGSMTFGSQYGTVSLATLPVVSRNGQPVVAAAPVAAVAPGGAVAAPVHAPAAAEVREPAQVSAAVAVPAREAQAVVGSGTPAVAAVAAVAEDIIANIERLAVLKEKGILTDAEFSAKKTELLARL